MRPSRGPRRPRHPRPGGHLRRRAEAAAPELAQPLLALLIDLVSAAGTVLVGERIYRQALLRTQGKLGHKEALRLAR